VLGLELITFINPPMIHFLTRCHHHPLFSHTGGHLSSVAIARTTSVAVRALFQHVHFINAAHILSVCCTHNVRKPSSHLPRGSSAQMSPTLPVLIVQRRPFVRVFAPTASSLHLPMSVLDLAPAFAVLAGHLSWVELCICLCLALGVAPLLVPEQLLLSAAVVVLQCYIGGNPFCSDHSQRC
jgi:hypothetical protein